MRSEATWAEWCRAWRAVSGESQAATAQRAGVAANTWARWERGELVPPPLTQEAVQARLTRAA